MQISDIPSSPTEFVEDKVLVAMGIDGQQFKGFLKRADYEAWPNATGAMDFYLPYLEVPVNEGAFAMASLIDIWGIDDIRIRVNSQRISVLTELGDQSRGSKNLNDMIVQALQSLKNRMSGLAVPTPGQELPQVS